MKWIGWMLSALGAIGGGIWTYDKVQSALRKWRTRRSLACIPNDFYYEHLEIGARISEDGANWEVTRTAIAVCSQEKVDRIDLGVRPLDQQSATYEIHPNSIKLERAPHIMGYDRFHLIPAKPLQKDDKLEFQFKYKFTKLAKQSDFITWNSNRRVDFLHLRVLFQNAPKIVRKQTINAANQILQETNLNPDSLTGEFQFDIQDTIPSLTYSLMWEK